MDIKHVFAYLYSQTAKAIHQLKAETYKATSDTKWAFAAPDGKTFRNKRPPQEFIDAGWTFKKVTFQRIESHISPQHERWREYQNLKHRATRLLAARLILKANRGTVPAKAEIGPYIGTGLFRSHARTSGAQKALAHSAYRYLHKLENRLGRQPHRFDAVETWLKERQVRELEDE